MGINSKDTSEIVKNTTEATKNVAEIVQMILQPRGIDAVIQEGHKRIIEEVIASDKYSSQEKEFFLANYKRQIKEYKNCNDIAEAASLNILPEKKIESVDPDWFSFFSKKQNLFLMNQCKKYGLQFWQRKLIHLILLVDH